MNMERKKYCDDCGHLHLLDNYCHTYVEENMAYEVDEEDADNDYVDIGDDSDSEEEEEEEEESDDDGDDDSDDAIYGKPPPKLINSATVNTTEVNETDNQSLPVVVSKKDIKIKGGPLETPTSILECGLVRCNCKAGIPFKSRRFLPFPRKYKVGDIPIMTYAKFKTEEFEKENAVELKLIQDLNKINKSDHSVVEVKAVGKGIKRDGFFQAPPYTYAYSQNVYSLITKVLEFVPFDNCGVLASVSHHFYAGVISNQSYLDIRDFSPIIAHKIHRNSVKSVIMLHDKIYTGGDRTVLATDGISGNLLSTVTRDSGEVISLMISDSNLYTCSTSGTCRAFIITHSGKNMSAARAYVGHSKGVCDVLLSSKDREHCEVHGIRKHHCFLFSASSDRTIRVWDMFAGNLSCIIDSPAIREASFTCLAQSKRHLFAGTTASTVMVFSKKDVCEREDMHMCKMPKSVKRYCTQATLKLPKHTTSCGNICIVNHLICSTDGISEGSKEREPSLLWAADNAGYLTVWYLPGSEGIEFTPVQSFKVHIGSINGMVKTNLHMITIGDDGYVVITTLNKFSKIKRLNINTLCVERNIFIEDNRYILRKLKCVAVTTDQLPTVDGEMLSTAEKILISTGSYNTNMPHAEFRSGQINKNDNDSVMNLSFEQEEEALPVTNNGNLVIGTSLGEIIMLPLGSTI
eukprot:CAMPEP_0119045680 /NCGR_PEP_ID=MMETSP1177-20130426/41893_1 /TAXON_ID=2985 /ORGANISM="Ochromonas sp, Strain CCMP1899" /LENGTH=688 /DNA_ID=CAMNT_0007017891 /DNA_START=173 /DNA_END=2239 /DNA_ORIENTATION=-